MLKVITLPTFSAFEVLLLILIGYVWAQKTNKPNSDYKVHNLFIQIILKGNYKFGLLGLWFQNIFPNLLKLYYWNVNSLKKM